MTTRPLCRRHAVPRRAGFTIVELLMVILIIGILAALLFPAIQAAVRNARIAEVTTEMKTFDAGIKQFHSRYGIDPPSFIVLYEQGDRTSGAKPDPGWGMDTMSALPGTQDVYRRASRAVLRQMWPQFDFTYNNTDIDLNGDGDTTDVLVLNGAECLVFFLGGRPQRVDFDGNGTPDGWNCDGFSADPRYPFRAGGNRIESFADFVPERLIDIDLVRGVDLLELMPEYLDTLSGQELPYQYFSSYEGRGYKPWGIDNIPATIADNETINPAVGGVLLSHYLQIVPNPPADPDGEGWNKNTFQLISPGEDQEFGPGGFYGGDNVPIQPPGGSPARAVERDNITNFKGGILN